MNKDKQTVRIIASLAAAVIGLVVIVFPLGYFALSYQHMAGNIETEAEINARIITQIISTNPEMWEFEQVRIQEYLERRPKKRFAETRRVFNRENGLVAESADVLASPVIKRSAKLFDSGADVGRIEVSRSLRPLLVRTGLLALFMLLLGAGAFIILRVLPIRAIQLREESLKKGRDTAKQYLDVAGVILLVVDAEQRVTMINRKGCEILGVPEQQVLHKNWFDHFIPDSTRDAVKKEFSRLMEGGDGQERHFENMVLTSGGDVRTIAWNTIVLRNESGRAVGTLSSGEDITERKRLEAQLRHAQKMESIGVLAGGVAHDFNNILTAVIGYANLLQMKIPEDDPLHYDIGQILAASNKATQLVKSLLAYSRKQIIDLKLVDMNSIVLEVTKLLSSLLREDIELRTVLAENALTIKADPGQIEQVMMNLATNARDAMPRGGLLTVETGQKELDAEFITTHGYGVPGRYALLTVSDTGVGMDKKTKEKIFDPFFTTKEVGKGTGLGLAMTYGIIKQHNGYITVYSEPGEGTTFSIYLPLIQATAGGRGENGSFAPAGGTETILVAEDDAAVRALTTSALKDAGYAIIEAADGEEAIKKFSEQKDDIHLAILDVIMPKRNGKVVFDAIKKMRPDVKALFISGYTADILQKQLILGSRMYFLSKPVSVSELLTKVREVLDG
ncbi:MAG TPA: ATP-binding protein [Nitrospirota bacterium]